MRLQITLNKSSDIDLYSVCMALGIHECAKVFRHVINAYADNKPFVYKKKFTEFKTDGDGTLVFRISVNKNAENILSNCLYKKRTLFIKSLLRAALYNNMAGMYFSQPQVIPSLVTNTETKKIKKVSIKKETSTIKSKHTKKEKPQPQIINEIPKPVNTDNSAPAFGALAGLFGQLGQ